MSKRIVNKRGSIPALVGIAVPMVLVVGTFAMDATRFWLHQARLQSALDAGALIAARDIDDPNRDAKVKAIVVSAYNDNARSGDQLTAADVQVTQIGTDKVQVTASKGITPLLGNAVRLENLPASLTDTMTAARAATANRTSTGVELALVFDITLSMTFSDGTNANKSRIVSARDAALEMVKILYGDGPRTTPATQKKWMNNLYISVVPFNVATNFGPTNEHFLDGAAPPAPGYVTSWTGAATGWGGCAEMRDRSLRDANPKDAGAGLRRYYWPSTYKAAEKYDATKADTGDAQPHCRSSATYTDTRSGNPSGAHRVCMGHNDWTAPDYVLKGEGSRGTGGKQNHLIAATAGDGGVQNAGVDVWTSVHGPNMMCPTQPVLPLTMDRPTIEARINGLTNLPYSNGTIIPAGLQAGWFALSPKWRATGTFAGWPSAEPSPQPNDGRPTPPALPLDYDTPNMRKVMVLLTDGDNDPWSARNRQGNDAKLVRPESRRVETFYNAYGFLGPDYAGDTRLEVTIPGGAAPPSSTALSNKATTVRNNAETALNTAVTQLCQDIRTKNAAGKEQITLYVIALSSSISSEAQDMLEACASKPTSVHYIYADTNAKLKAAFTSIGNQLANLRLTQ